jgi:hypothetical protein
MSDLIPCPNGCSSDYLIISGVLARWVKCVQCSAYGPSSLDKNDAITEWNTMVTTYVKDVNNERAC